MCVCGWVWGGGGLNEHGAGELEDVGLEKIKKMKCGLDMQRCGSQEAKGILGSSEER